MGVGLFIQLPLVSAQEFLNETVQEDQFIIQEPVQEAQPEEDSLRIAEQAYSLGGNTEAVTSTSGSSVWAVIRMLLVLALVAAAIYGIVYFLKKKNAGQDSASDPFLKVLANSHLGNNRYAHIVSVGGKAWLLGSSDGGVNLIGEIDDKDLINAMLLEDSKKAADTANSRIPDFMSLLRKLGTPVEKRNLDAEELRKRRERLKGL